VKVNNIVPHWYDSAQWGEREPTYTWAPTGSAKRYDYFLVAPGFEKYIKSSTVEQAPPTLNLDHKVAVLEFEDHSQEPKPSRIPPTTTKYWSKQDKDRYTTIMERTKPPTNIEELLDMEQVMLDAMKGVNKRKPKRKVLHKKPTQVAVTHLRRSFNKHNQRFNYKAKQEGIITIPPSNIKQNLEEVIKMMETQQVHQTGTTTTPQTADHTGRIPVISFDSFNKLLRVGAKKAGHRFPPVLYYLLPEGHKRNLHKLIEEMLQDPTKIPNQCLCTSLWLIHKRNSRHIATNYRPISIPHPLYRIITLAAKMHIQLQLNPQIGTYQHGFRQHHTCGTAVMRVRAFRHKFKGACSVMLDVRKAFDCVDRVKLLNVAAHYLDDGSYQLIKRLYENPTIGVPVLDNVGGRTYKQKCGVRQGCPLSPHIFTMFLDMALRNIQTKGNELLIAFADDISIHCNNPKRAQQLVNKVIKELQTIGLMLDPKKCEVICENDCEIQIGQTKAKSKPFGRLLGQWI